MIKYVVRQNNNETSLAYGKFYAYPVVEETIDLNGLARHMEEHNSGFSEAMCVGVMKAMVKCIKEQLLAGKNVKIDDLAIFSCGIRNKEGADSAEEFSTSANIAGVKLRARATGTLSNANLNLAASIKKAGVMGSGTNDSPNNTGTNGGSTGTGSNTGSNGGSTGNGSNTGSNGGNTGSNGGSTGSNGGSTGNGDVIEG